MLSPGCAVSFAPGAAVAAGSFGCVVGTHAARLGQRAVELLADDIGGRAVGIKDNKIIDVSIEEAVEMPDHFDEKLFHFNSVLARF